RTASANSAPPSRTRSAAPHHQQPESAKPYELFLRIGSESARRDYSKRLCAIVFALASCPVDEIENVLEIWQLLEMESGWSRRMHLFQKRIRGEALQ
ncbi:hypothetical protein BG006_004034, partial [Podila minutissima]